jgi:Uma2 family endonuclease
MSVAKLRFTPEQYLELERKAEHKSEFLHGEIFAMAGASRAHQLVGGNVFGSLHAQLRARPCEVYSSDMRVQVEVTGLYTYPDLVVACGKLEFTQGDTLANPTVIIEVLSPSTEACDRGEKFAHYRRLESLTDYVLVSQDRMRVEHYVRQGDQWVLTEVSGPAGVLNLASIGCQIRLADIYEKVEFPEPEPPSPRSNGAG